MLTNAGFENKCRQMAGGQQCFIWGRQFDYHAMGLRIDSPGATYQGRSVQVALRME